MDLDFLSGQMLMVGFRGTEFNSELRDLIRTLKPSGVILFGRNIVSPSQVAELIGDLQAYAREIGLPPLLVSIDYEGGVVVRANENFTPIPGAMAISATRSVENAGLVAGLVARELRSMGINVNLAPVADVNSNPLNPIIGVRSFGDNPLEVARFVESYVSLLQLNGVLAVAKHFPGHGDTSIDSHLDLPVLDFDLNVMWGRELPPFKAAIRAGVSGIMTAHIVYSGIDDSGLPATLSRKIITDLLRHKLNFRGLVMTDALEMRAIYDRFSPREIAYLALNAGVDLFLICNDYDLMLDIKSEIFSCAERGEIDGNRLLSTFLRLNEFREKFNLYSYEFRPESLSLVGCKEHRQLVYRIFKQSITLVKNENIIPLRGNLASIGVIIPKNVVNRFIRVHDFESWVSGLLNRYCGEVRVFTYELNPSIESVDGLLDDAGGWDPTIIFTYNALLNDGQVRLVKKFMGTDGLIVVACGFPYDILAFPSVGCYVATYGLNRLQFELLIRGLFGEFTFTGCLPVDIDGLYRRIPLDVD